MGTGARKRDGGRWMFWALVLIGVAVIVGLLLSYDEIMRPARCEQAREYQRQALADWGAEPSESSALNLDFANARVMMICHRDSEALNNLLR